RHANSRSRASRGVETAQKRRRRCIFEIERKADPAIRRFREKRKDQSEREAGPDPDRNHNDGSWKRRIDGWRRLVKDRDIRKCQFALQLRLFRRPFSGIELFNAEAYVTLQFAHAVALRLNADQLRLRPCLRLLERGDLRLRRGDTLLEMLSHSLRRLGDLLANRREI